MYDYVKLQLPQTDWAGGFVYLGLYTQIHNGLSNQSKGLFHYSFPLADIKVVNINN